MRHQTYLKIDRIDVADLPDAGRNTVTSAIEMTSEAAAVIGRKIGHPLLIQTIEAEVKTFVPNRVTRLYNVEQHGNLTGVLVYDRKSLVFVPDAFVRLIIWREARQHVLDLIIAHYTFRNAMQSQHSPYSVMLEALGLLAIQPFEIQEIKADGQMV